MRKILIVLVAFLITLTAKSQDLIIQKDGEEIKSKVLEVNLEIIKYKKFDNLNGPSFEISKSDVFLIKYENGTKDVFNVIEKNKKSVRGSDLIFTENQRSFSILYGLATIYNGSNYKNFGPIILSYDRAVSDKWSFAIRPSYINTLSKTNIINTTVNALGQPQISNTTSFLPSSMLSLQIRFDLHFKSYGKIDPYWGIGGGIGYKKDHNLVYDVSGGQTINYFYSTIPLPCVGLGLRMYGNGKNAFIMELGYEAYSYFKVGYLFGSQK